MSRNEESRLPMLAALWDGLAAGRAGKSFHRRFSPELERLRDFQRTFPQECPGGRIRALESKIIQAIREEFPREEILRLRARLNRSN